MSALCEVYEVDLRLIALRHTVSSFESDGAPLANVELHWQFSIFGQCLGISAEQSNAIHVGRHVGSVFDVGFW